MFSRGNISEKIRMSKINLLETFRQHNLNTETLINFADLFVGIGYFTLQILKSIRRDQLGQVALFEWNPVAVNFINQNLALNFKKQPFSITNYQNSNLPENISEDAADIKIFQGDNRLPLPANLKSSFNRINLGLIPCCCGSLKQAIYLADLPCVLHVHHNIDKIVMGDSKILPELFDPNCLIKNPEDYLKFGELAGQFLAEQKACQYKLLHVEKVKSYGPKVDHKVFDILLF